VELLLRLKSAKTCSLAFGGGCADFEKLPSSLRDKISTIKRELLTTPSIKQLLNARNEFLENNVEQYVKIVINADGVEGEKSGGTLKGDVVADIYVGAGSYEDARRGEVRFKTTGPSRCGVVAQIPIYNCGQFECSGWIHRFGNLSWVAAISKISSHVEKIFGRQRRSWGEKEVEFGFYKKSIQCLRR
jgi:hypothetical protein